MANSLKIPNIVRIRQMLKHWRRKAMARTALPSDVPSGHVAISVGPDCTRFVIRASYLNHPMFKNLLVRAEEEYGFTNAGPIMIPCDESYFEEVLRIVSQVDSGRFLFGVEDLNRCCHAVGMKKKNASSLELVAQSWPLLRS